MIAAKVIESLMLRGPSARLQVLEAVAQLLRRRAIEQRLPPEDAMEIQRILTRWIELATLPEEASRKADAEILLGQLRDLYCEMLEAAGEIAEADAERPPEPAAPPPAPQNVWSDKPAPASPGDVMQPTDPGKPAVVIEPDMSLPDTQGEDIPF